MNFGCLILVILALLAGGWFAIDWFNQRPHRERVEAEKASFLKEVNPQLKSVYDKLQAELSSCEASIANLRGMARSFNQQGAKAAVESKIRMFEGKAESLRSQLNRIEEEAEKGVALRTFNQIDGGGMVDQDIAELLKDSQAVLSDATTARKQMAAELGQPSLDNVAERASSQSAPPTKADLLSWTNSDGRSLQASFQGLQGTYVVLKTPDGTQHRYPLNMLAPQSQAAAKSLAARDPRTSSYESPGSTTYRVVKTADGYLNMRSGPGLSYPPRGRILGTARGILKIGDLVHDKRDGIEWMPVRFGGVEGYVSANFLVPE